MNNRFRIPSRKWWLVTLVMGFALVAAYQVPYAYNLQVGQPLGELFLSNFQAREVDATSTFRWSTDHSTLNFPGPVQNQDQQLSLRLAAGARPEDAPAPEVTILANGVTVGQFLVEPWPQTYKIPIARQVLARAADLTVEIQVPTFKPSVYIDGNRDTRDLGVVVQRADLTPSGTRSGPLALPSFWYILAWLLGGWLGLAALLQTPLAQRPAWLGFTWTCAASLLTWGLAAQRAVTVALLVFLDGGLALGLLLWLGLPRLALWRALARTSANFSWLETLGLKEIRLRWVAGFVLSAYPVLNLVQFAMRIPRQRLIDLFVCYVAARVLQNHDSLYALDVLRATANRIGTVRFGSAFSNLLLGYTHPPSATFFDLRFAWLAWADAKLFYTIETFILYVAALLLLWLTLKPMAPRVLHWAFPVVLFALWGPTRASLGIGQSDILIFFLMALFFWAFSRDRELLAGVALGLAILTKLTPAVFVLYLIWKREWRAMAYSIATAAGVVLVTLPFVGIETWFQFITQIFPALSTGTPYAGNQSVGGLINRLLLDPQYSQGLQSAPSIPIVRAVNMAVELALVGLTMLWTRGRLRSRRSLRFGLEFSAWLTVMLLISPIAWDHYFTWLLLPVTVLLASWLNQRRDYPRALLACAALAAALWLAYAPLQTFQESLPTVLASPLLDSAVIILALLYAQLLRRGELPETVTAPAVVLNPVGPAAPMPGLE